MLLQVTLFEWNGSREELDKWVSKYAEACKKHDVVFKGLYAPLSEPYNFAMMIDNESEVGGDMSRMNLPFMDVGFKPPQMGILIQKTYVPQQF